MPNKRTLRRRNKKSGKSGLEECERFTGVEGVNGLRDVGGNLGSQPLWKIFIESQLLSQLCKIFVAIWNLWVCLGEMFFYLACQPFILAFTFSSWLLQLDDYDDDALAAADNNYTPAAAVADNTLADHKLNLVADNTPAAAGDNMPAAVADNTPADHKLNLVADNTHDNPAAACDNMPAAAAGDNMPAAVPDNTPADHKLNLVANDTPAAAGDKMPAAVDDKPAVSVKTLVKLKRALKLFPDDTPPDLKHKLPRVDSPRLKIEPPRLCFPGIKGKIVDTSVIIENITKSYVAVSAQTRFRYFYLVNKSGWVLPPGGRAIFRVHYVDCSKGKLKTCGRFRILSWEVEKAMEFDTALHGKRNAAVDAILRVQFT
ncbi:hypothetical protein FEM48_Zijuj01G0234500 [Ziziphus jujuba var. spinosa]|uniref:MSP domain-containing protein n=1 Tax=Ziziphus jujuba var. spinosa TaxID=714518 RepID=A0A978W465_ZIZJJ|nr:hypothetical protein FEM48_Zijuj01G0234500 [Ziziphus jujuba var. spinosa]